MSSNSAGVQVRFSLEPRKKNGQWENVEYIRIIAMNDKYNQPHRPVEPSDKVRFSSQYEAWKKGLEEPSKGQPLKTWPGITPAEVNVLGQAGIHTVEALASAPDALVGLDGPYLALRDTAKSYLELSAKTSAMQSLRDKVSEQEATNATLSEQVAELQARLDRMSAAEVEGGADESSGRRGSGRPRKNAAGE